MGTFTGTAGNDTLTGTSGADSFDLHQGGEDNVQGLAGNDTFKLNGALDAGDQINGGSGNDDVTLHGDYSAGVVFNNTTLVSVETVVLSAGFTYKFTTANGNVAAGASMTYNGEHLAAANTITIDASAETDGKVTFVGGAGNDSFTGGSFANNFALSMGGEDTARGGAGNDSFAMGGALDAGDHLTGGGGSDLLRLEGDYSQGLTLADTTLSGIGGIQFHAGDSYRLTVAAGNFTASQFVGLNANDLGASGTNLFFDGSATAAGFHLEDGTGNDTLIGGQGADNAQFSHGGNDTFSGGGGDDKVIMGNKFSSDDQIDGGAGNDTVELTGLQTTTVVFTAATMVNVENLLLEPNHNYRITTADQTVAAGATMLVAGNSLVGNILVFDGSAETDGHFTLRGGTGNDVLTGGAQSDTFNLLFGGNDTASGGGGNDTINIGAQFTAADKIDGGSGADIVTLAGDYSAGLTLGATTLVNVETLSLGTNFSYSLTTNDATVAAGQTLTVDASALAAANTLTLDASAETNGFLAVTGGAGNDHVTFGALAGSDSFNGGAGNDTLTLNGDYSGGVTFSATTLTNVETLSVASGHSYSIITNDGNVAAGQTLAVDASALGAANTFNLNASAETNGSLAVTGGAGNDSVTFGAGYNAGDTFNGGAGSDTLTLNGDFSAGLTFGANALTSVETLALGAGHSYVLTLNNGNVAAGQTLAVTGAALTANGFSLDASAETDGTVIVTGGLANDTVTFGAQTSDVFNGGGSSDTLILNAGYSGTLNVTSVESLVLAAGHNYSIATTDADIASSQTLAVDASALGAANALALDASAQNNGSLSVTGGAGNDSVTFGAQAASDSFNGGAGNDRLTLNGDYSGGVTFGAATMVNVETLAVAAGHSYSITTNDANIAAGQTLTVDASALGAANTFTLNAAAETNGSLAVTGGAGNDSVTFGAGYNAGDTFNGGAGSDTLTLNGDFSGGFIFGANALTSVETLALGAGHSYVLTLNNGNVAAGQTLAVTGAALTANGFSLDASAETDGTVIVTGGLANDTVTFGAQTSDVFNGGGSSDTLILNAGYSGTLNVTSVESLVLAAGHNYSITATDADISSGQSLNVDASALGAANALTLDDSAESDGFLSVTGGAGNDSVTFGAQAASDSFNGGAGNDRLTLASGFSGALSISNVETLVLTAGHNYALTITNGNVAPGQTLSVDASALGAANTLTLDASAQTNGPVAVTGGAGNDSVTFGAPSTSDSFNGGAGNDLLTLNGDYSGGFTFSAAALTNVETLALAAGHSYALTTNDANLGAGQTLTVDASALGAANTLSLNVAAETNGFFAVTGGAGNDSVIFGGNFASGDSFNGGAGNDTLTLNGDYSGGLTLGALPNVETLALGGGHVYVLTATDATVGAGQTLAVNAGAAVSLTFDGSAETDGSFAFTGTAGNDTLVGGAQADSFDISQGGTDMVLAQGGNDTIAAGAALTAADSIDGGAGNDTVTLSGDYSSGITLGTHTITGVETLALTSGHSYAITTNDGNVDAGKTLTVDGSTLNIASVLVFNGSAETDGNFDIIGGAGNDSLTGGNGNNTFDLSHGGADVANGGNGPNTFIMGAAFDSGDRINGALGTTNTLVLNGPYLNFSITNSMVAEITNVQILGNNTDSFVWTQAADRALTLDGSASTGSLTFDFSAQSVALTYLGGADNSHITGGSGNDIFNAGSKADIFTGNGGADTFNMGANFSTADQVNGGTGADVLNLNGDYSAGLALGATTATNIATLALATGHSYAFTTNDATVAAAATMTIDGTALGAGDTLTVNGIAETDGSFAFKGGAGADALTGGAQADSFDLSHGGADTAQGNGGNDTFILGAALTASDSIDGGTGSDTVQLAGDYSAGLTLGGLTSIETLTVAAGHTYNLTTTDGTVAAGQTLTVDASALGAANALTFNGAAELDGGFVFTGGAGNDALTGGAQADSFDLSHGGTDTATGNGGNDTFNLGATLTAQDSIDGGAGNDSVSLNGDYSAGVTFTATTLANIESLTLAAGHSYKFTTNDTTVAAGQALSVDGSTLGASDVLTFNGAAETDGGFVFTGGAANDVLTGGAQADSFDLSHGGNDTASGGGGNDTFNLGATFTTADTIDGGTGSDTIALNGDYSAGITFTPAMMTNVEAISLAAGHSYKFTTIDTTVASGSVLAVDGSALGASDTLTFIGTAETNGGFSLTGGAGNDSLTGGTQADSFDISKGGNDTVSAGNGNDTIQAGAALNGSDSIDGGAGSDTIVFNGDYSGGVSLANTSVQNVETFSFAAGHSYNISIGASIVPGGATLTVDGSALGAGDTLAFDGENASGTFNFTGGAGADTLRGSTQADTFDLSKGGADTAFGMGGNDTFQMGAAFTASDAIDGGTGTNIVVLNGDYSAPLTLGAATLANIQTLTLTGGHSYNLTTNDGNVAAAARLTIDASSLGAGDTLTFNGTAETDGGYTINDGAGNDTITGGGGNDTINITKGGTDTAHGGAGNDTVAISGTYTAADTIDGGTGTDTLFVNNGDFNLTLSATAFQSIEGLSIGGSNNSYRFTTTDDLVGAGQTFTVDASGMSAALTFDGSAETNGSFAITGSSNNDTITVGGVATTVNAGAGNDTINVTRFIAADTFNGGSSGSDTLALNGDFGAITLTSNDLNNIGNLTFAAGHNYNIAITSSALFSNQALTVDGSALAAANNFTFDGTQKGGGNALHVIGGAGDDTVLLANSFNTGDQYNGGSGNDTLKLSETFGGTFTFNANTISNVDTIVVAAGGAYSLTLQEGNIASGQTLTVDGSALDVNHTLIVSTTQLSHGGLNFIGGAAGDEALLGATADADTINGNGGNDTAIFTNLVAGDSFNGGAGSDTLGLNGDFGAITLGSTMMNSVETLAFNQSHSYNVTLTDADVAAGQTLAVNASGLGTSDQLTFDDTAETDGILHITGGAGADTFKLGTDFTANTQLDGGGFFNNDTLILSGNINVSMATNTMADIFNIIFTAGFNYTIVANGDESITAVETVNASALGAGNSLHWSSQGFYEYSFLGGAGDDVISDAGFDDTWNMSQGGNDTVTGGNFVDTFNFGAALTAADTINGGTGNDILNISGDYSAGLTFASTTINSVETLNLGNAGSYKLTMNDANVASGATLTISGSTLTGANALTFDGSAETDGFYKVTGGAGNDTFIMGGALKAGDAFNGGSGSTDTLSLNGDYSSLFTFASTTMTNIDVLQLAGGHSYDLSLDDANVASSALLTVDASALTASDALTLGTSDANSRFAILGGAGNDFVTFGSAMSSSSTFNGGAGFDVLSLGASASFTFSATTLVGVEKIQFTAGGYSLTTNDANVAAGQTLIVEASTLTSPFTFNGGAETDGSFAMDGSQGNDTLTGGAQADTFTLTAGGSDTVHGGGGNDVINMGSTFTSTDTVDGGAGNDTLQLNGSGYTAVTLTATDFVSVETLVLGASGANYGITTLDANVASGATLTVDASTLAAGAALTFNGGAETDGSFSVIGGTGNDTLTGGALADSFDLTKGGNDTVHGGGGNDVINMGATYTISDVLDGGAGNDTVQISGNTYTSFSLANATLTSVETLVLGAGFSYGITTGDPNVPAGQTLTVDASALGAANTLSFNGAAETDGFFAILGGAGNDTVTFAANFSASDSFNGGAGSDTLTLNGNYAGLTFGANTAVSLETLVLGTGHSYAITTADSTVSAGQTLTINAGVITGSNTFSFNGSAETDGSFNITGAANGMNSVTGGAGNDTLTLTDWNFGDGTSLVFDGGAGSDTLVFSSSPNTLFEGPVVADSQANSVEKIVLTGGASYSFGWAADPALALTVDASTLTSGDSANFSDTAATAGFTFIGGGGSYEITGGSGNDTLDLHNALELGINQTGGGNDVIDLGNPLELQINPNYLLDGGSGSDTVAFNGDYSTGFDIENSGGQTGPETEMWNIEKFTVAAGHSYFFDFESNDSSATVTFDASALGASDTFHLVDSSPTHKLLYIDGAGNDTVLGTALADTFNLSSGGVDNINGEDGNDIVNFFGNFTTADTADGGAGTDTFTLNGDYSGANKLVLTAASFVNFETLQLQGSHNYDITTNDGNVAAGQTLTVDASGLGSGNTLAFDGSAETNGSFTVIGGAGNDTLKGGLLADTINTGSGNDTVTGGGGADSITATLFGANDTFNYNAVTDSTSSAYDHITNVNFDNDVFHVSGIGGAITGIDAQVNGGTLSTATFDTDLAAAVGPGQLAAHHALLYMPDAGTLANQVFLVIDTNGVAGYQAGQDLVIWAQVDAGTLAVTSFG